MDAERARGILAELARHLGVDDEQNTLIMVDCERVERVERAVLKLARLTSHEAEVRAILDEGA